MRSAAPALISTLLVAQTPFPTEDPARMARNLESIQRSAAIHGLLIVLDSRDDDGPFLEATIKAAEDPLVGPWIAYSRAAEPSHDAGEMAALAHREGWKLEPGWVVLDQDAKVVAHGTQPPTAVELRKAFQDANLPTMETIFLTFLRDHPEREDAWQRLYNMQYTAALTAMAPLLEPDQAPAFPKVKEPLNADQDQAIWGGCEKSLAKIIEAQGWKAKTPAPMGEFITAGRYWALSPTMRSLVRRLMPDVESILRRYPENIDAWSFWLTMAEAADNPSLPDFLASLSPKPGCEVWPPRGPAYVLMEAARKSGDATQVLALSKQRFEEMIAEPLESWGPLQIDRHRDIFWNGSALPYLDLLTQQGQDTEATRVLARAMAWTKDHYEEYVEQARQKAWGNKRNHVADHWRWLKPKAPKKAQAAPTSPLLEGIPDLPKPPFWIVMDDGQGLHAKALREATAFDMHLAALDLPIFILGPEHAQIRAKLNQGLPGWGLVTADGQLAAREATLPDATAMIRMSDGAGLNSHIAILETFLRQHPEQQEAYAELLSRHLKLAAKRASRLSPESTSEPPSGPSELPPLAEAQDARTWGASAKLLASFYRDEGYRLNQMVMEIPPSAGRSRLMRRMADALLPELESWILRNPVWEMNWKNWITLNKLANRPRPILPLLQRCPPLPGDEATFKLAALLELNRQARAKGDWQAIIDFVGPVWDSYAYTNPWRPPTAQPEDGSREWEQRLRDADGLATPLVEAYLKLKRYDQADLVVRDLLQLVPSKSLAASFIRLARGAEQDGLAKAWASAGRSAEKR